MISADEKLGILARRVFAGQGTGIFHWDEAQKLCSATIPSDRGPKHFEADCPLLLFQLILGIVRKKRCLGPCGEEKPLTSFARAGESEESRAAVCSACERAGSRKK
jgi:hypothetical protein